MHKALLGTTVLLANGSDDNCHYKEKLNKDVYVHRKVTLSIGKSQVSILIVFKMAIKWIDSGEVECTQEVKWSMATRGHLRQAKELGTQDPLPSFKIPFL